MNSSDLLKLAGDLTSHSRSTRGALRQVYLRRSISTAYYALFHALARFCADELVGAGKSKSAAWRHAYRALEHGPSKNILIDLARQLDSQNLKLFADAFATLQQVRHEADYDPHQRHTMSDAEPCSRLAVLAIPILGEMPPDMRLTMAVSLLMRTRR